MTSPIITAISLPLHCSALGLYTSSYPMSLRNVLHTCSQFEGFVRLASSHAASHPFYGEVGPASLPCRLVDRCSISSAIP
jgi:hypothetical protein